MAGPTTRRFTEQRWLIDNTIRAVGMDWDQPRSIYLSSPCGPEANADFALIATLDGTTFPSERWFVESTGRVVKTPL
jgi:hypothetical protein